MKRTSFSSRPAPRTLLALICASALMAVACDNDATFNPVVPDWPNPVPSGRSLHISGTLEARDGRCIEATVLYDGVELAGARSRCPGAQRCAKLELDAFTRSTSGRHTISFKVLHQSQEVVDYLAEGTVLVDRDGLALGGAYMPLRPTSATLRPGGAITFEINFID